MPEMRITVWGIERLAMVWHQMEENAYKAPEQLQSSGQLEHVIHFLCDYFEKHKGETKIQK
jgi:hypothetical protein